MWALTSIYVDLPIGKKLSQCGKRLLRGIRESINQNFKILIGNDK